MTKQSKTVAIGRDRLASLALSIESASSVFGALYTGENGMLAICDPKVYHAFVKAWGFSPETALRNIAKALREDSER